MLTFPNPAKLNLDSYLRVNIIVWLLDAQDEPMLRLCQQSGHVVGWPILKDTWLYSPEAEVLGCPSQGAGSLLECGPATWEVPAACCSFPAVMVGGQSGTLVWPRLGHYLPLLWQQVMFALLEVESSFHPLWEMHLLGTRLGVERTSRLWAVI